MGEQKLLFILDKAEEYRMEFLHGQFTTKNAPNILEISSKTR